MDFYLGSIVPFAGSYAPEGWCLCDGRLLSVTANEALFSIYGPTYGGDGRTTFGIPDLRGRFILGAAMGGSGDQSHPLAQMAGQNAVALTAATMPSHTHTPPTLNAASGTYMVSSTPGNQASPAGAKLGASPATWLPYTTTAPTTGLPPAQFTCTFPVSTAGSSANPVISTTPPYLAIEFWCCLQGLYPARP